MDSFKRSAEPPLAADGGIGSHPHLDEDPYHTLDDLMAAVEVLCPSWPPREPFMPGGRMLL